MAEQPTDVRRRPIALPTPVQHERPPPRTPEHHGGAQPRDATADNHAVKVVVHRETVPSPRHATARPRK
jgi:hypothetical protein